MFDSFRDKGLSGLSNLGNTCFLNTTLQCLSHTYELHELLDSPKFQARMKRHQHKRQTQQQAHQAQNTQQPEKGLLMEYDELRKLLWNTNCIVTPGGFIRAVHNQATKKNRPMFTGYSQNDVSEFVHFLLESFHEDVAREVKMTIRGNPSTSKDRLAISCLSMMSTMYQKEYSEFLELFFGIHVSRIVGMDKQIRTATPEPFFTLCLPIPTPTRTHKLSLYDCFDAYTQHERMDGDNQWFNEATGQKETVHKGVVFWSLPKILVVELKRYQFKETMRGLQLVKNSAHVEVNPSGILNLSKYVVGYKPHEYQYELYGICNHMGTMNSGHYVAYVKNANGKWYQFNDRSVSEIPPAHVVTGKAYALWFRRCVIPDESE